MRTDGDRRAAAACDDGPARAPFDPPPASATPLTPRSAPISLHPLVAAAPLPSPKLAHASTPVNDVARNHPGDVPTRRDHHGLARSPGHGPPRARIGRGSPSPQGPQSRALENRLGTSPAIRPKRADPLDWPFRWAWPRPPGHRLRHVAATAPVDVGEERPDGIGLHRPRRRGERPDQGLLSHHDIPDRTLGPAIGRDGCADAPHAEDTLTYQAGTPSRVGGCPHRRIVACGRHRAFGGHRRQHLSRWPVGLAGRHIGCTPLRSWTDGGEILLGRSGHGGWGRRRCIASNVAGRWSRSWSD
jgi:hypothetical protein